MFPTAGHAVILTGIWPWASNMLVPGDIGIINGRAGSEMELLQVIWHYSAFRGFSSHGCPERDFRNYDIYKKYNLEIDNNVYVSCSGGPGTIALPANLLKPTDEVTKVTFWCWRDIPRENGGFHYSIEVPVWKWNGKGYD